MTKALSALWVICNHAAASVPPPGAAQECPAGFVRFWPAVALGAMLLPWTFYPAVGDASYAFEFTISSSIVLEEATFRRLLGIVHLSKRLTLVSGNGRRHASHCF